MVRKKLSAKNKGRARCSSSSIPAAGSVRGSGGRGHATCLLWCTHANASLNSELDKYRNLLRLVCVPRLHYAASRSSNSIPTMSWRTTPAASKTIVEGLVKTIPNLNWWNCRHHQLRCCCQSPSVCPLRRVGPAEEVDDR